MRNSNNQVRASKNDERELLSRIKKNRRVPDSPPDAAYPTDTVKEGEDGDGLKRQFVQWTTTDNKNYFPAARSVKVLAPGLYDIRQTARGEIYFESIATTTEGLLRFPETNCQEVVNEIQMFWKKESLFKEGKLSYKRGILLWGPPGGGKTCTIKLAMQDLIKNWGGVVVKFAHPAIFSSGLRILREIQPNTPVIVLMEDIDAIIEHYNESEVINILDGVDMIEKVVFLATTNYPEKLGERVLNRPSRFDRRFKIGMPNEQSRRIYLEKLLEGRKGINIDTWVKDTDQLSIAHIRELFIAVVFLENDYEIALNTLKEMSATITSEHDGGKISL